MLSIYQSFAGHIEHLQIFKFSIKWDNEVKNEYDILACKMHFTHGIINKLQIVCDRSGTIWHMQLSYFGLEYCLYSTVLTKHTCTKKNRINCKNISVQSLHFLCKRFYMYRFSSGFFFLKEILDVWPSFCAINSLRWHKNNIRWSIYGDTENAAVLFLALPFLFLQKSSGISK